MYTIHTYIYTYIHTYIYIFLYIYMFIYIYIYIHTNRYGKYSITVSAVESWNKIQKQLKNMLLKDLSLKIKTVVTNFYLKSY